MKAKRLYRVDKQMEVIFGAPIKQLVSYLWFITKSIPATRTGR